MAIKNPLRRLSGLVLPARRVELGPAMFLASQSFTHTYYIHRLSRTMFYYISILLFRIHVENTRRQNIITDLVK